jgi:hypothetical protein
VPSGALRRIRPSIIQDTYTIAFGRDGRLVLFQAPYSEPVLPDNGPPGIAAAITSLAADLRDVRAWNIDAPYPVKSSRFFGWARSAIGLAADADGRVYLVEAFLTKDLARTVSTRLRMFSRDGRELASWGSRGTRPGLEMPLAIAVDDAGRVWVVDRIDSARAVVRAMDRPPDG